MFSLQNGKRTQLILTALSEFNLRWQIMREKKIRKSVVDERTVKQMLFHIFTNSDIIQT